MYLSKCSRLLGSNHQSSGSLEFDESERPVSLFEKPQGPTDRGTPFQIRRIRLIKEFQVFKILHTVVQVLMTDWQ